MEKYIIIFKILFLKYKILNEPKIYRINKRKISRKSNKIENEQSKKSFLNSRIVDENKNKNYVLAPMKSIPITSISFRARMKYFSNKKEKNIEKLKKEKREEEKNIYTFQPKTSNNSLKVIKYNNNTESGNNTQKKKKVDYNRINNLYLDYKDKKSKIDILTKDYFKNEGISFMPKISDRSPEIKQFKNRIGQIPLVNRIEIYNASKQGFRNEQNIPFYQTELF